MTIPKKYRNMVGDTVTMQDALRGKEDGYTFESEIFDVRFGSAKIMDRDTMEITHPTVEFKVLPPGYKKKVWTLGFACPEIKLKPEDDD